MSTIVDPGPAPEPERRGDRESERGQSPADPRRNLLLAALPADAYERIAPTFERMSLENGRVLHRPGEQIRDLYFPIDCMISVTVRMHDGRTSETAVVGSREVVGINAFMGGRETTQTRFVVQIPGDAVRVPAVGLRALFDQHVGVRDVMLRYTQAMIAQVTQNAACNGLHRLEQRYARWLLEVHDRVGHDEVPLTHEFISQMLGVRRAGVTDIASRFEEQGVIHQRRGYIRVVDRVQLEAAACECYRVLAEEYGRLLGPRVAGADRG